VQVQATFGGWNRSSGLTRTPALPGCQREERGVTGMIGSELFRLGTYLTQPRH